MNKGLGEIILYQAADGGPGLDVRLERESVWLSLYQLAELFERDKSVISRHLRNVFKEGELERSAVVAKNATTAAESVNGALCLQGSLCLTNSPESSC